MNNSQIHKGFLQEEIRNFLAISLVKCFDKLIKINDDKTNIVQPRTGDKNPFKWELFRIKKEIETLQLRLEIIEEQHAIFSLILNNGWEEFDVSDETYNDSKHTLVLNFLGTQKEYEELLKRIHIEKQNK